MHIRSYILVVGSFVWCLFSIHLILLFVWNVVFFLDIWLQAGSKHYVFFVLAHLTRFLFFFMFLVCPRSPPIRFTTIFHHYYHHSFIRWNNRKTTTTTTRTSFSIYLNGDLVIITYKYSMEFIQRFW